MKKQIANVPDNFKVQMRLDLHPDQESGACGVIDDVLSVYPVVVHSNDTKTIIIWGAALVNGIRVLER